MSRTLVIVAASALALIAVLLGVSGSPHAPASAHPSSSHLSWAAKGAISSSLGRDQTAFYAKPRSGGLIADNEAQRLTTHFGSDGVLVRSGATTFGLQLLAWGTAGHTTAVAPAAPRADANRVTYAHGPVTEWYANGPLGLEQGFDVRTAPATTAGDRLTLVLGLRGNARARSDGHGGLSLTGPGDQRLSYAGLSATDAHGRVLGTSLTAADGRAVIHVDTAGAVYPLRIDPFIQVAKFGESSPAATIQTGLGANGISVAGTTAAVSVSLNNTSPASGAVDIFVANSGRWELGATRVAQLTDPNPLDNFASALSLSADGHTLAVGASSAVATMSARGVVFVFTEPPGDWASTTTASAAALSDNSPSATDGQLGRAVSVSTNGSRIAAGMPSYHPGNPNVGAVDVFDRTGATWAPMATPSATATTGSPGDFLGQAVALSGNTIVAGAIHAAGGTGAAYIFQRAAANSWPLKSTLAGEQMGDFFGWATAISADAKTVVVTAVSNLQARGAAYVFTSSNGTWPAHATRAAKLTASNPSPGDQLGESVAIDGNVVLAGAFGTTFNNHPFTGAAFVFVQPAGGWRSEHEAQELAAPDGNGGDSLGQTAAISNGTGFVAAPGANAQGTMNRQGFIYAFGSFPSTAISSRPATPSGSNGWFIHPINVTVSASDLDSTVKEIRCALDPADAPMGFSALPACGFLAPAGATVAANGLHVLYAAATNAAGYTAAPVSRTFKIDTGKPRVKCAPTPGFPLHGRGGLVAATVADRVSGPAAPIVAKRANVSRAGKKTLTLTGRDNAGNAQSVKCHYTVVAPKLPTQFTFGFSLPPSGAFTIFTALTAKKVPRGGQIKISCKGGGCPFAHRTVKAPTTRLVCKRGHKHCKRKRAPALTNINLEPLLAHRQLTPHAVLTLAATKPNTTGVISTFTVRKGAGPSVASKCLAPGSKKPFSC
ncbi:MAG: FG-GAP repeat protein [Solirubrobacteraceae bacterium]